MKQARCFAQCLGLLTLLASFSVAACAPAFIEDTRALSGDESELNDRDDLAQDREFATLFHHPQDCPHAEPFAKLKTQLPKRPLMPVETCSGTTGCHGVAVTGLATPLTQLDRQVGSGTGCSSVACHGADRGGAGLKKLAITANLTCASVECHGVSGRR